MTAASLDRLTALIAADGGLIAAALRGGGPVVPPADPALGSIAAAGPCGARDPAVLALAVEAAYEGHLLHRGRSRVLDPADRDLALLAGDRLYALSLAALAEAGEVAAVAELADAISLCARAQAEDRPDLEAAAWEAAATAIGWGPSGELEAAKAAARSDERAPAERLREAARRVRGVPGPAG
jgi:hypothetical protein